MAEKLPLFFQLFTCQSSPDTEQYFSKNNLFCVHKIFHDLYKPSHGMSCGYRCCFQSPFFHICSYKTGTEFLQNQNLLTMQIYLFVLLSLRTQHSNKQAHKLLKKAQRGWSIHCISVCHNADS